VNLRYEALNNRLILF